MGFQKNKSFFRDTTSIAGWLFADLFLGLIVIFLATSQNAKYIPEITQTPSRTSITPTHITATISPTSSPTATPAASPTILPTAIPSPDFGLDPQPVIIYVNIRSVSGFLSGKQDIVNDFILNLDAKLGPYKNYRAGLVITEGYDNRIMIGLQLASKANEMLISNFPIIFQKEFLVDKAYWHNADDIYPSGTIRLEIFFYTK